MRRCFKKKDKKEIRLKTDTFVVKTNVHFPTDLNLLWDSLRKVINLCTDHCTGWRKSKSLYRTTKTCFRHVEKVNRGGGKNKQERLYIAAKSYLEQAEFIYGKVADSLKTPGLSIITQIKIGYYQDYVKKLICLVERRLLKGEKIPHNEKIFSIFEPHTRWIVKGKAGVICELGQKMLITTNEDNFIVSWKVAGTQEDVTLIQQEVDNTQAKYPGKIGSHSFDKGFSKKSQNQELKQQYPGTQFVIEKKGKPNQKEKQEQQEERFKTLRKKHNAVESNIHELMCCGLDLCVDKGEVNYRRYVALGVLAYNIKKLGTKLIQQTKKKKPPAKAA